MTDRRREHEDLRRQLAEVDAEILRALRQRAKVARQLGALGPIVPVSAANEREQIAILEKMAEGDLPAEVVRAVFLEIRAATSALERPARIVYVGREGGLSYEASQRHFGLSSTLGSAESVELAIDEVVRQRADFAVIPFESSIEGPVQTSIEALAATELFLGAKVEIVANLSVMSRSGQAAEVEKIYVYATDRVACENYVGSRASTVVV